MVLLVISVPVFPLRVRVQPPFRVLFDRLRVGVILLPARDPLLFRVTVLFVRVFVMSVPILRTYEELLSSMSMI